MDEEDLHIHTSLSLLQFMSTEGLIPTPEEDLKRDHILNNLKTIVLKWIKRVAWQRRLPVNVINAASATILPYGSYGLGVHNSESDIDAVCAGPCYASRAEDFFVVLCNMLKNTPGVSDVHTVKDAKLPLMRFNFEGISVDLPYAQLQVTSVSENVDMSDPSFLTGIDDNSRKSLSGVGVNQTILQLVPNLQNFLSLLRCIKFWAKRRKVYGNLFGYLGGIHLAILAAFICMKSPDGSLSVLVMSFFNTFSSWPWPAPVVLQEEKMTFKDGSDERMYWMPIRLPCSPYAFCHSNITRGTFNRIRTEFLRGFNITRDLQSPDFDWGSLFEPFEYRKRYSWFLKIYLSAWEKDDLNDWVGWLEEARRYCDPNPTEYIETESPNTQPSVVFCWGLHPSRAQLNIALIEEEFRSHLSGGPTGKIRLAVVQSSEFPTTTWSPKGTKPCWRIPDSNQQTITAFSDHLPNYFIGYALI